MCMCVPFLYSFVATFGWVWFPAFNLVFLLIKSLISKHRICVTLKLFLKLSVLLEKIHTFRARVRTEWTVLVSLLFSSSQGCFPR